MQFLIYSLFVICLFINGSFEQIPGHFLGYNPNYIIVLPRSELSSCGMTLSKCLDICGFLKPFSAAIKREHCICAKGAISTKDLQQTCAPLIPCPGNSSEFCGCENGFAYYTTEYLGQCTMSLTIGIDSTKPGLYSTNSQVTVQMYGDAGQCMEGSPGGKLFPAGETTSIDSICRELGTFQRVRYGLVDPNDALYIIEAKFEVPSKAPHKNTYKLKYNNWLGKQTFSGQSYGSGHSVVDLLANGSYVFPDEVGGPFFKPFSTPSAKIFFCSLNSGCNTTNTYFQVEGFFFKKQVFLPNLYQLDRIGCLSPRIFPSDVTTDMPVYYTGQQLNINSAYTFNCSNGGVFIQSNTSGFKSTCTEYGTWNPPLNLECRRDCIDVAPLPGEGMTSNRTSKSPNKPGEMVTYSCGIGAVFKGTLANSVSVECLNSGQWSVKKLPRCISPPPNEVRCMRTSSLRSFKADT